MFVFQIRSNNCFFFICFSDTLREDKKVIEEQKQKIAWLENLLKEQKDKSVEMQKTMESNANTVAQVNTLFTGDQMHRLENPNSRRPWFDMTIQNCIQDYCKMGYTSYCHMRKRLKNLMPHPETLRWHLRKVNLPPGIWYDMLELLKIKAESLPEEEKVCSLIFDEMALKSQLTYDMATQKIVGYVTTPLSKKQLQKKKEKGLEDRAYHAFTIMLVCLFGKCKQTIDFHLTGRSFDAEIIAQWLKDIITEVKKTTLTIASMCMDMSTLNLGIWKAFSISVTGSPKSGYTVQNSFTYEGFLIYVLSDVPHCHFIIHDEFVKLYGLKSNQCSFKWIWKLVEFDQKKGLKLAHHLTKKILQAGQHTYGKMKVGPAIRIFSRNTSIALRFANEHYPDEFPDECLGTCVLIEKVSEWYQLMSGRSELCTFVKDDPEGVADKIFRIERFVEFFCSMQLNPKQHLDKAYKPCQVAVILSSTSIVGLVKRLLAKYNVKYFMAVKGNNDPIEGYNGGVRGKGKDPTPLQYMWYAKAMSMTQYMGPLKGSYEASHADSCLVQLQDLKLLKKSLEKEEEKSITILDEMPVVKESKKIKDRAERNSLAYIGGVILKRTIRTHSKCEKCEGAFVATGDDKLASGDNQLIAMREYKEGALTYPTAVATAMFLDVETLFREKQELLKNEERIGDKHTDYALKFLESKYKKVPTCHLRIIFARFIKARLHFWTQITDETEQEMKEIQKEIEAEACSSKTSKSLSAVK